MCSWDGATQGDYIGRLRLQGAILRLPFDDRDILLFSGPGRRNKRDDITVHVSFDRGES